MVCPRCQEKDIQVVEAHSDKLARMFFIIIATIILILIGKGINEITGHYIALITPPIALIGCLVILLQKDSKTKAVCINSGHKWYI